MLKTISSLRMRAAKRAFLRPNLYNFKQLKNIWPALGLLALAMAVLTSPAHAQSFNCMAEQSDDVGNTFIGGVPQAGGNTNPSNLLSNLGSLGVNITGYQVVKDEAGAAGCLTTSATDNKSGTWSSNFTVTHIAVWGGNGVAYYDVTDGGSG
jgi:hypothetical protein